MAEDNAFKAYHLSKAVLIVNMLHGEKVLSDD